MRLSVKVTLKIFNTLGQEIETLVNEEKATATYEVKWNAAGLPSGVYLNNIAGWKFCWKQRKSSSFAEATADRFY